MLNNNSFITINNHTYQFHNRINTEPELLKSFNQLAQKTFDIQFQSVGGDYEPHVLVDGTMVCANVSVNQIPFRDRGIRKFYVQIGTVMTQEDYRNRGLSRWLLEAVIEAWKNKCDGIYLFANDAVLDFYPKFGFESRLEHEYVWKNTINVPHEYVKLCMDNPEHERLVFQKYGEGNIFSSLSMIENQSIFEFYAKGVFRDNIYYMKKQNVIVFAEWEADRVYCYDIYGKTDVNLKEILQTLKAEEVILGFTPRNPDHFSCRVHKEEDTTLFVRPSEADQFDLKGQMFPIISHA